MRTPTRPFAAKAGKAEMGSYVPSSAEEKESMLAAVGARSIDDLYAAVPESVYLTSPVIPEGKSELEVLSEMTDMAEKNTVYKSIFRGAGAYHHYIPSIVKTVIGKEAFRTTYTPYQAEISQGILQSIFEYQTMICELTGMDVSNASVYDGASAAAESIFMCQARKRTKAVVSGAVHPQVIETIKTYCHSRGVAVEVVPVVNGETDKAALAEALTADAACLYFQQPNYFGVMEDGEALIQLAHDKGALAVMGVNPIALGLMKTPGELGADIAVGEGQPLGMPLSFGGPYLGFMACKEKHMRKLPGRIVGETKDARGGRCFVLTLQAREQHIRREKASSNICSNEALCAMTAGAYLTAMGAEGLRQAATLCLSKAHYLAGELEKIGCTLAYDKPFFHEFVTKLPIPAAEADRKLAAAGILGGLPVGEYEMLWCVTELNTKAQMDEVVAVLKGEE